MTCVRPGLGWLCAIAAAVGAGLFSLGVPARPAGMDCARAAAPVERLVCDNASLRQLDDDLAQAYRAALVRSSQPARERAAQRDWLSQVRDRCTTAAALHDAYVRRLAQLRPTGAATAACPVGEADLVGAWVRRSGPGFFEEMAFAIDGSRHDFESWLHHRPEFSGGSWTLKDCVIHVRHASEEALAVDFRVTGLRGAELRLESMDDPGTTVYRKVHP